MGLLLGGVVVDGLERCDGARLPGALHGHLQVSVRKLLGVQAPRLQAQQRGEGQRGNGKRARQHRQPQNSNQKAAMR